MVPRKEGEEGQEVEAEKSRLMPSQLAEASPAQVEGQAEQDLGSEDEEEDTVQSAEQARGKKGGVGGWRKDRGEDQEREEDPATKGLEQAFTHIEPTVDAILGFSRGLHHHVGLPRHYIVSASWSPHRGHGPALTVR